MDELLAVLNLLEGGDRLEEMGLKPFLKTIRMPRDANDLPTSEVITLEELKQIEFEDPIQVEITSTNSSGIIDYINRKLELYSPDYSQKSTSEKQEKKKKQKQNKQKQKGGEDDKDKIGGGEHEQEEGEGEG